MDVVTQAVINLRAVGLCVNRLHFHALDIGGIFGAVCFRAGVHALVALPNAGQRGQRAQMGERVAVGIAFGVDVFRVGMRFQVHLRSLILLDKILPDEKKQPALSAAAIGEKALDIINAFAHAPKFTVSARRIQ